jgi:hypothetical protein
MKNKILLILILSIGPLFNTPAQETEPVLYFLMEPFDDSLFIQIQEEVFIDPPDPKAEIIVDLRDPSNETVSIKGMLYPLLAFSPEIRARIQTYPFKLNLEDDIHYASVFTRVFEKMHIGPIIRPPTVHQISASLQYINPFLQFWGGERFGVPLKSDIGISFGLGTPYSGAMETNWVEFNFHILGFKAGVVTPFEGLANWKDENRHNNLYTPSAYQFTYVIPFGNFFEAGYYGVSEPYKPEEVAHFRLYDTLNYQSKILHSGYFNWEFRYPISILASTRAKFYVASFLDEMHFGFIGRELSISGTVFDFRFDAMTKSDIRQPQYVIDVIVQKIFDNWAFSSFAIGPSVVLSKTNEAKFGVLAVLMNVRIKVGTSL